MANKRRTFTRTNLSTFGTDLGSVVRSNLNKFNSLSFCFILDKTLQLEETPIANPIVHSPSEISSSNPFEIFHYNLISIELGNDCLADVVIDSSHKPSLFSRQLFKKPSGTSSAFALKFTSQEFEFPFNLFDLRGMEKLSVRSDSEIINPQVHTESSVRTRTDGAFLGECKQEETFAFGINSQKAFINLPTKIILEIIRDDKGNFNSSFESRNAQKIILERKTSWRVISNGTEFNNRFSLGFLDHPTGLFNAGNSKLRRQSHLFQFQINKWMKLDVIHNSQLPSLINTELHSFFIGSNSPNNFFSWFNFNLNCRSGSHNNLNHHLYINLSEGIFPPKHECMGIQNAGVI